MFCGYITRKQYFASVSTMVMFICGRDVSRHGVCDAGVACRACCARVVSGHSMSEHSMTERDAARMRNQQAAMSTA